jgi:dTDP-4-amino-4,6-dideoxygalactose transaminase
MSIPVFRPTLRRRDFNSVLGCLVSDRLRAGPLNHELAAELSRYLGAAGGACLATFGQAVACALEALGLAEGEAVVLSALAPAEYLEALAGRGLRALVADVDPGTGLILRSEVERHSASAPKALVLHYPLGCVPESDELFCLGLPVLEDISQSLGASLGAGGEADGNPAEPSRRCGSLGAVSVLSLAPEGIITAGAGAAVFARERRELKGLREAVDRRPRDALLSDLNAALGLAQAREIEGFLKARRAIAEVFSQAVARSRHGRLGPQQENTGAPFAFPVLVKDGVKQVRQFAMKRNLETCIAFADTVAAIGQGPAEPPPEGPYTGGGQPSETRPEAIQPIETQPAAARDAAPPAAEAPERPARSDAPPAALRAPAAARDLLARCVLFPLYPTLLKRDLQLIVKVLSALP